jgi:hypothetical protein
LSFRKLSFFLFRGSFATHDFRDRIERDCAWLRVSIEVVWDLLVLREIIVQERLMTRTIIHLILVLISLIIVVVVEVVKIAVVPHVHVIVAVVVVVIVPTIVVLRTLLFEVEADVIRARFLLLFGVKEVVVVADIDIIRVVVDLDFVLTIIDFT